MVVDPLEPPDRGHPTWFGEDQTDRGVVIFVKVLQTGESTIRRELCAQSLRVVPLKRTAHNGRGVVDRNRTRK